MSVYRVNKTRDFTVMGNTHLRDKNLSLKAVGLLSKMLSFNDGWQFSTRGLAAICKEGPDAILSALKELEKNGYLVRHRGRDSKGRLVTTEFDIYESPQAGLPHREKPHKENPDVDSPDVENPHRDNPAQINTIQVTNQGRNTLSKDYQSINLDGMDMMDERSEYEEIIRENLDYNILCQDPKFDKDRFREIMDIMLDAVCSTAPTIRINGEDIPNIIIRKTKPLGHYGRLRKAYLEMHRPILFNELVLSDKLFEHCAEIDEAARNRMELIVRSLAEQNGVTEQLKAKNQMEWVRQMNACKAQAEEIVKAELIYD